MMRIMMMLQYDGGHTPTGIGKGFGKGPKGGCHAVSIDWQAHLDQQKQTCQSFEAQDPRVRELADEDWQTWREEIIRHRLVMSLEGELQGLQVSEIVRTVDKEVR